MQVLRAYESVCLADAQGITVLRAISKGNAPNLVAELAAGSAELYRQATTASTAAASASAVPRGTAGAPAPVPLAAYASWKAAAFDAYAFAFAGGTPPHVSLIVLYHHGHRHCAATTPYCTGTVGARSNPPCSIPTFTCAFSFMFLLRAIHEFL